MKWFVKSGLIGAALGAGFAAVKASRRTPEEVAAGDPTARLVLRGALFGATGGVSVGWIRQRGSGSGAQAALTAVPGAEEIDLRTLVADGAERTKRAAESAKPHLESARDSLVSGLKDAGATVTTSLLPTVVAAAEKAVDAVGDALHDAVEAGRPAISEALHDGWDAIEDTVESGRKRVAALVD